MKYKGYWVANGTTSGRIEDDNLKTLRVSLRRIVRGEKHYGDTSRCCYRIEAEQGKEIEYKVFISGKWLALWGDDPCKVPPYRGITNTNRSVYGY
jgi:hypothetical protein